MGMDFLGGEWKAGCLSKKLCDGMAKNGAECHACNDADMCNAKFCKSFLFFIYVFLCV